MTALAVEFFCWYQDDLWNKDDSELLKIAMPKLEELSIIKEGEIVDYFVHKERYAYPVYDLGYGDCLKTAMTYLNGLKNLKLIGRSGTFTYMGQYRAMEAGSNAVDEIVSEIFKEPGGGSA